MYCDGTYAETPTSQTTSIPGERPVQSTRGQGGRGGQVGNGQAGEEKSSGGFFGSLGSLWPFGRQAATTDDDDADDVAVVITPTADQGWNASDPSDEYRRRPLRVPQSRVAT